jgi:hypothetical protein
MNWYKHLEEITKDISDKSDAKIQILRERVLANVYRVADGITTFDCSASNMLRAAQIFLKHTDSQKSNNTTNNFIQINNIYINQNTIETLPDQTRTKIERLLTENSIG